MSIHPAWTQKILDGEKTVEVRRRPPEAKAYLLVLYATAPTAAVVGTARIARVHHGDPTTLWRIVGPGTALDRRRFLAYLDGAAAPGALELISVVPCAPISLPFRPPQSWMWLRRDDPAHSILFARVTAQGASRPQRVKGST
jgi:predicted transcriptional regulator